jgi:hypothetical protein
MRIMLVLLATALLSPALSAATFISSTDTRILYTGRWDQPNNVEPWAFAKGTSVIANFQGTSLAATISATTTDHMRIIIDDDAADSLKIQLSIGTDTYQLAANLDAGIHDDGIHKVEIVKETAFGRWTFHGFDLDNGEDLVDPPSRPPLKLVYYGDSNLAGDSLEHEQNNGARSLQGSYYGYAGIASRMLGAEYSNISRSGASIRSLHSSFDRIDWNTPGAAWNFKNFQPDAVIINIGANDVGRPKSKMRKDYNALLNDMREAYPHAHIMLYNAWGWDYAEPANFIEEVIKGRRDPNMSWAIFPWLFEQWHGCEYDHSGMAHVLVQHLETELEWERDKPADVMNGYGTAGNVANGGFEEVAPFGGYGWRYYTDTGVSREMDEPHTDQFFLRLDDGASVHQPNLAMDGETFTVTAWVRGKTNDDKLHVTIDFRDQNIWTTPLQSYTKTFGLTDKWNEIEMIRTAPVAGTNPVFHTRLTFQAADGSTVDIDDVIMQVDSDVCEDWDAAEICDNLIDDDCDGQVDGADTDCSIQECTLTDDRCSSNSDCCSNRCSKGKPSNRVCLN